jgi:hypothetical protein
MFIRFIFDPFLLEKDCLIFYVVIKKIIKISVKLSFYLVENFPKNKQSQLLRIQRETPICLPQSFQKGKSLQTLYKYFLCWKSFFG